MLSKCLYRRIQDHRFDLEISQVPGGILGRSKRDFFPKWTGWRQVVSDASRPNRNYQTARSIDGVVVALGCCRQRETSSITAGPTREKVPVTCLVWGIRGFKTGNCFCKYHNKK